MDGGAGDCDGGLEAALQPAVACGEPSELFEMAEAAFDTVARFVERAVVHALHQPVAARRDDDLSSHLLNAGDDGARVIAAVRDDGFGRSAFEQGQRLRLFGGLAWGQAKVQRLAKAVREQMDLGAQTASASPQSLVFGAPFLRPAAACW